MNEDRSASCDPRSRGGRAVASKPHSGHRL